MPTSRGGALLGLFREPDQIIGALDELRAAGVSDTDLEVVSGTPYPAGTFGEPERPHHLFTFAFSRRCGGFHRRPARDDRHADLVSDGHRWQTHSVAATHVQCAV